VLAALACACASFALDLQGLRLSGLDGTASAWAAAISALAGYQGLHIVLLLIAAPYLALRAWRGHLADRRSRATLDNIALIWHYTTLQGIAMWTADPADAAADGVRMHSERFFPRVLRATCR
jgi:cytochrome c oxidase subunit I+III